MTNRRVCANGLVLSASIHAFLIIGELHYVLRDILLMLVEYVQWEWRLWPVWCLWRDPTLACLSIRFVPLLRQLQSECSEVVIITGELPFIAIMDNRIAYWDRFGTEI